MTPSVHSPRALLVLVVWLVSTGLAATSAVAASFTLNGPSRTSSIAAAMALSSTVELSDVDRPTALPLSGSVSVAQSRISATTTYSLSEAAFAFGFDHVRRNAAPFTESDIEIFFRPDADVDFVFSGIYSALDGTGHPITLSVLLNDLTTSSSVFASYDFSRDTPNEVFALGQSGGEFSFVFGLPTGRLLSGHDYALSVLARIEGDPLSDDGIFRATGSVRLEFVPEPSTALLLGLGLGGLSRGRRREARPEAGRRALRLAVAARDTGVHRVFESRAQRDRR